MITIKNRNLIISSSEKNLGFYGDNLRKKVEFLLTDDVDENAIFRLYLIFDNGAVNFLRLETESTDKGVKLTWNVLLDHIYKSGVVTAQIKAFENDEVIWHTTADTFVVSSSPEESHCLKHQNAEFLQYEDYLNDLIEVVKKERTMLPYVGENGNWFIYDINVKAYVDSGMPSAYEIENPDIADRAVTGMKIALEEIGDEHLINKYWKTNRTSIILREGMLHDFIIQNSSEMAKPFENIYALLSAGVDGLECIGVGRCLGMFADTDKFVLHNLITGKSCVVVFNTEKIVSVEDLNSNNADQKYNPESKNAQSGIAVAQAVAEGKDFINAGSFESIDKLTSYNYQLDKIHKIEITADLCAELPKGVYFGRFYVNGSEFLELTSFVYDGKVRSVNIDTGKPAISDVIKITTLPNIEDKGNYFVSETIEGALQELAAEVVGVAELLAQI